MKKTTRFKQMLLSDQLEFICEAHNGLSAKIVEEAGFDGIWASGLSISAAMGVRDNNEASWTQVLEVLEFMCDNTSIPTLLDGDTGYGNFNNMRRLVKKLEQRGVAAVCIEDKIFPKTNSFIKGEAQPLADVDEFCGKIKAGKDAQTDDDFCIVARTEAFISGWGLEEALRRARAYADAGADAILCHSKIASPKDINDFMGEWGDRCPVVIVPTMYYATPTQHFADLGVSLIIWANHILRTAIKAMQETANHLVKAQSLVELEPNIPPVKEIFRLQGMAEYSEWEKAFLPKRSRGAKAILLAASKGQAFGKLTENTPKAMLEVEGKPIIQRAIRGLREADVRDITVVTGFKPEAFQLSAVKMVQNAEWQSTGEVGSLLKARNQLDGPVLVAYGDVVCRNYVLENLVRSVRPMTVVVNYAQHDRSARKSVDYARVTPDRVEGIKEVDDQLRCIDTSLDADKADGEWTGLLWCTDEGTKLLNKALAQLEAAGTDISKWSWSVPQLISYVVESGTSDVAVQFIHDAWLDIDDILDLSDLYKFYQA